MSLLFFYYRRLGKGQGENHHRQSYRRPPAPEIQPVDRRVLTVEEMEIFLKEIFLERLRVAMFLSLFTGARMGEILSLEWGDLNEKKRSIRINKDLERVQLFDDPSGKKTELIVQEITKSKSSNRDAPIYENIWKLLLFHRQVQIHEKQPNPMNLLFQSKRGPTPTPGLIRNG